MHTNNNTIISSSFTYRHIATSQEQQNEMLKELRLNSLEELINKTLPPTILNNQKVDIKPYINEKQALYEIRKISFKNKVFKNYIGLGYYGTITPAVIQRNILENPGWYTQYTPYQAEISQGRLESLFNFQTMICDLTGLDVSNASLLDEGTAAAEAMFMCKSYNKKTNANSFLIANDCFPQTIAVIKTRAKARGINVIIDDPLNFKFENAFGCLLQYPNADGNINDYSSIIAKAHQNNVLVVIAADILALTILKSCDELKADIAVGSVQRFGIPLFYGGPHAGYIAARQDLIRFIPGRIVGLSKDKRGNSGYRLALQTREQHIRREKATSNICTAQALLANMAVMYAIYHGPQGLKNIALKINSLTQILSKALSMIGFQNLNKYYFDTLKIYIPSKDAKNIINKAYSKNINLRLIDDEHIGISLDETTTLEDVKSILEVFGGHPHLIDNIDVTQINLNIPSSLQRTSQYLTHPVFNKYHSETELMRYIKKLEYKDLSLTLSMIPLGSCTMKLNAAVELLPISWPEFCDIHPFAPINQTQGYQDLIKELNNLLCKLTGFDAFTFQPNAGAQGEFCGLLIIKKYFESKGEPHRNLCLIPSSAHGTNPASAAMAGMKILTIQCDKDGNIDINDLRKKCEENKDKLATIMITYPSTHGVFEENITEICKIIHEYGGQVYMDGANMNAQVGLCFPGNYGFDLCHLNLHKTFSIPHGGGGPGVGPVGVKQHLKPFLPSHPLIHIDETTSQSIGTIASAPFGSIGILAISFMYIKLMGFEGLRQATKSAILNANYVAHKLQPYYPTLYKGKNGFVAHECIINLKDIKKTTGITVEDIAKRLMDYGFHAPTISFPVADTMMIEPTESESKDELDRFIAAMISIYYEIEAIKQGTFNQEENPIKNAPHTIEDIIDECWNKKYTKRQAVLPNNELTKFKFWPSIGRIDNAYGDRNIICKHV